MNKKRVTITVIVDVDKASEIPGKRLIPWTKEKHLNNEVQDAVDSLTDGFLPIENFAIGGKTKWGSTYKLDISDEKVS